MGRRGQSRLLEGEQVGMVTMGGGETWADKQTSRQADEQTKQALLYLLKTAGTQLQRNRLDSHHKPRIALPSSSPPQSGSRLAWR